MKFSNATSITAPTYQPRRLPPHVFEADDGVVVLDPMTHEAARALSLTHPTGRVRLIDAASVIVVYERGEVTYSID